MAITGGDPLNSTFRERLGRFVKSAIVQWLSPPPAAAPAPGDLARQGVGKVFNRLAELRQGPPGAAPAQVGGAGWVDVIDPILREDVEQQALWASEEAKYGRVTTAYGTTPQAWATMSGTDITLETIATYHREVDNQGILYRKADMDFAVNRRDPDIYAAHRARIAPAYKTTLQFSPQNRSPLAWALCAFVRAVWEKIPNFAKAEEDLATAAAHGYAGLELVRSPPQDLTVQVSKRRSVTVRDVVGIASLEWVHPRDFRWHPVRRKVFLDSGGGRYVDPFRGPDGRPTYKLIWHGGPGFGDPHQRGYDFAAAPLHFLKQQSVARWSVVLELFGIQTPYMQYEPDGYASEEDISGALSFLGLLGRGKPSLLAKKFGEVKLTPPAEGVDARGQHAALAGYINSELAKLIQGQTLTMEIGGSGSYAAANVQADTKEEVQIIDARLASETWTHQLIPAIIEENIEELAQAFGVTPDQIRANVPRAFRVVDRAMDPAARLALYVTAKEKLGINLDNDRVAAELNLPVAVDEPGEEDTAPEPAEQEPQDGSANRVPPRSDA